MKNFIIIVLSVILITNFKNLSFDFIVKVKQRLEKGISYIEKLNESNSSKIDSSSVVVTKKSIIHHNQYYYKSYKLNKSFHGNNYNFYYKLKFKADDYNFYHSQEKDKELNYYSQEFSNHEYLDKVVEVIGKDAHDLHLSKNELANLTVCFVQNCVQYKVSDNKFPIESLVEGTADCKGKSVLIATLLKKEGFGVKLLLFPQHMTAAIRVSNNSPGFSYYKIDGAKYTIIESTEPGWQIGQFPSDTDNVEGVLNVL